MDKILILGGTAQQIKLIEAAKRKGYYTIVTDYLSDSLAKRLPLIVICMISMILMAS